MEKSKQKKSKEQKPVFFFEEVKKEILVKMNHEQNVIELALGLEEEMNREQVNRILRAAMERNRYSNAMELILQESNSMGELLLLVSEFAITYYRYAQHHAKLKEMMVVWEREREGDKKKNRLKKQNNEFI